MEDCTPHHLPAALCFARSSGAEAPWFLRLGLFLYDHLGGRNLLLGTRRVNFPRDETGRPLESNYRLGFEYSDCWVDDARLVVLYARDAADRGAKIFPHTEVINARRQDGLRYINTLGPDGQTQGFSARVLVNASGPWVYDTSKQLGANTGQLKPCLIRGSHIVVPRLYDHDRCYILQNGRWSHRFCGV